MHPPTIHKVSNFTGALSEKAQQRATLDRNPLNIRVNKDINRLFAEEYLSKTVSGSPPTPRRWNSCFSVWYFLRLPKKITSCQSAS